MKTTTITFLLATTLLISTCPLSTAQKKAHTTVPTPTPAPAPAPAIANISQLLTVAGPFHIFLNYLQSTNLIDTFQNQANNTKEGLTLFVPKDSSFNSLKKPSLANLTNDQLKKLCLFHALPHYYSLSDFNNISNVGPVPTFAGGDYTLNFTDVSGTIHMNSGWSITKISSSVWSAPPVAIYQVDKVLLPEAIFGTDIPPVPAPAPEPVAAASPPAPPAADSPIGDDSKTAAKGPSSAKDSSASCRVVASLVLALSCVIALPF